MNSRIKSLHPRHSLRAQIALASGVMVLVLSTALSFIAADISRQHIEVTLGEDFARRAASTLEMMDRAMFERYREIQIAATLDDIRNPAVAVPQKRAILGKLQDTFNAYAWIGICDTQGVGIVGTGKYLEGKDLSKRPWCTQGRNKPYIGDVHDALLLAKLLPNPSGEMFYLLDVAAPVHDRQGNLQGVLCGHIYWRWAEEMLYAKRTPNTDLILINRDGLVLAGPIKSRSQFAEAAPQTMRAVLGGTKSGYLLEKWQDGHTYLTGYARGEGYRDYPGLGWTTVFRQDINLAFAPARRLQKRILLTGAGLGLLFAWLGWILAGRIVRPIRAVEAAAARVSRGDMSYAPPAIRGDGEVAHLSDAIRHMAVTLMQEITERKQKEAHIQQLANYDQLTGLPNRTLLMDRALQALALAQRDGSKVAILFIDLDRFKTINDSLGHDVGDNLLKHVAQRFKTCLRRTDTLARQGGDEFVAILPDLDSEVEATHVAEKLIQSLQMPLHVSDHTLSITPSIGISLYPDDSQEISVLMRNADLAMYRAKELGRNTLQFFTAEMNLRAVERLELENRLRDAIVRQELSIHYQPQFAISTGELTGMEALLRWHNPYLGAVSPYRFIPVAEETGLIEAMGEWVLRQVCLQGRIWLSQGLLVKPLAVNLSMRQLGQSNLADKISAILRDTGFPAHMLELELTESMLMELGGTPRETLLRLQALGISLALDDFGTGYSSLSRIKVVPLDRLKIDQSFVRDLTTDPEDAAIVRAIIAMGQALNLRTLAEGVETQAQLDMLKAMGCDEIQGYLTARPAPADTVEKFLSAKNSV